MKHFFKDLFEYSHHCNQQLATAISENENIVSEKTVKLYSHIISAHQIWNNRIQPTQKIFQVWQEHSVRDFQEIDMMNYRESAFLLEQCDLNKIIDYKTGQGHILASKVQDILFHVINHSTYHRAQIASEFRSAGIAPLMTDYILYKR
ncbi:DinB family protein [Sphingobacterium arenae]|uniref:Damage-inducible protein DinB n=1 Tax=Sphingobacterium arenae TaxID=1280598 RepID=A0ABR7Y273_9SPHI|nr:DinB family protein [Sphingobacterium arenae]MBD1425394.1 damage-inducible protein DinB [Sphingobacterium arenae]